MNLGPQPSTQWALGEPGTQWVLSEPRGPGGEAHSPSDFLCDLWQGFCLSHKPWEQEIHCPWLPGAKRAPRLMLPGPCYLHPNPAEAGNLPPHTAGDRSWGQGARRQTLLCPQSVPGGQPFLAPGSVCEAAGAGGYSLPLPLCVG